MERSAMRELRSRISLRSIRPTALSSSVQARRLEEAVAVGGDHVLLEGAALAIDRERHLDAGGTARPDAAIESRQIAHLASADREHDVAGVVPGLLRRP